MTARPTIVHVDLKTTAQTIDAIDFFKQHHNTLKNYGFEGNNEENLTKFLESCLAFLKPTNNTTIHRHCTGYSFSKQFITLDKAKLLTQFINVLNSFHITLSFGCGGGASPDAIEYLVAHCGTDKNDYYNCNNNNKRRKRQPKSRMLGIFGGTITYNHVKCLDQALMTSSLYELKLSHTQIANEGATALANSLCKNKLLVSLDLNMNGITDLGVQALGSMLCQNTCLQSLNLSNNYIENNGVVALGKALRINSTLQKLFLQSVGCSNGGLLGLADGLAQNTGLKELDLNNNKLNDEEDLEGMEALGKSLMINSTLVLLSLSEILSDDDNGLVIGKFVKSLNGKASKLCVDCSENSQVEFTEDAIDCLTQCNAPLLSLDLGSNNLQPNHFEIIARAMQEGTFNIQGLRLDYNELDDDCIIIIFNALVEKKDSCSLVELSMDRVEGITADGAKHIVDNLPFTKLQQLLLAAIPIGDDGVKKIATYLNDTELTTIGLDSVGMEDSGLIALSNALKSNTKLTYLDIYNNSNVTNAGKEALLQALQDYNKTLIEICFLENNNENTIKEKIEFYVALNKTKRDVLCDSNALKVALFPFIFERHYDNPSVVYWILQSCPHLYCLK